MRKLEEKENSKEENSKDKVDKEEDSLRLGLSPCFEKDGKKPVSGQC